MPKQVEKVEPQPEPTVVEPGAGDSTNPPEPQQAEPVAEPLDERGVPLKNKVAELERKLQERDQRYEELQQLNQQYQQAMGQQYSQQAATQTQSTATDPVESQFDEQAKKFVESIARRVSQQVSEETGYRLISQAATQNTLSENPELVKEARTQYANLQQNPLWRGKDDALLQQQAIAQAENVLLKKKLASGGAPQPAGQPRPAIPKTSPPSYGQEPPVDERKAWIEKYIQQPESREMLKRGLTEFGRVDPDSERGQKILREVAADEYDHGTRYGGAVATAAQAIRSGDPLAQQLLGRK